MFASIMKTPTMIGVTLLCGRVLSGWALWRLLNGWVLGNLWALTSGDLSVKV